MNPETLNSSDRAYLGNLARALAGQLDLLPDEPVVEEEKCGYCVGGFGYVHRNELAHPGDKDFGAIKPCPVCRDPEIEAKALARALRNAAIPQQFAATDFDTYRRIPEADIQAADMVEEWVTQAVSDPDSAGSILLAGEIGTGKTGCGAAAFRILIRETYRIAAFVRTVDLFAELGRAMDASKRGDADAIRVSDIVDRVAGAELLMLDDIGAETATDYREEKLYQILGRRYDDRRTTIVTTNKTLPELKAQIGPRTYSRLVEMCAPNLVQFECDDLRIAIANRRAGITSV